MCVHSIYGLGLALLVVHVMISLMVLQVSWLSFDNSITALPWLCERYLSTCGSFWQAVGRMMAHRQQRDMQECIGCILSST